MTDALDIGHLVEGVVETDPLTGLCYIAQTNGSQITRFDVQEALKKLQGQEVRLTLVTFEAINNLANLLENPGSMV